MNEVYFTGDQIILADDMINKKCMSHIIDENEDINIKGIHFPNYRMSIGRILINFFLLVKLTSKMTAVIYTRYVFSINNSLKFFVSL
jgi:hypothetical protein